MVVIGDTKSDIMDPVTAMLGDQHSMYFCDGIPWQDLVPGQSLAACIDTINKAMASHGRDTSQWRWHEQNTAARLVRANWIYQRLDHEPIIKPILVANGNQGLHVLCGDTRIMALTMKQSACLVKAVMTQCVESVPPLGRWIRVCDAEHLAILSGLDPDRSRVAYRSSSVHGRAIDWLEIGDASTAHHLHNEPQRIAWFQDLMDSGVVPDRLDIEWTRSPINWPLS